MKQNTNLKDFFESAYAKGIFNTITGQVPKIKFSIKNKSIVSIMSDNSDTIRGKIELKDNTIDLPDSSFIIQDLPNLISFMKTIKNPIISLEVENRMHIPLYLKIEDELENTLAKFVLAKESIVKNVTFPENFNTKLDMVMTSDVIKKVIKKGSSIKSEFVYMVIEKKKLYFIFSKDYKKLNNSIAVEVGDVETLEEMVIKFSSKELLNLLTLFDDEFNISILTVNNILYLYKNDVSYNKQFIIAPKK